MNGCKVCNNPVLDTKDRRLLVSKTIAYIKRCSIDLVCQLQTTDVHEDDLFSEGYLCRDCYLTVDKYLKLKDKLDLQNKELTDVLSVS